MDVLFAMLKGYQKAAGSGKRKRATSEESGDEAAKGESGKKPETVDRTDYGNA